MLFFFAIYVIRIMMKKLTFIKPYFVSFGIVIKQVNTCKYLGIMIDDKLSWQDHIDFVYNKVVRFVSIIYRIRHRYVIL